MVWDGYGYARERRSVNIQYYPVSWKFLVITTAIHRWDSRGQWRYLIFRAKSCQMTCTKNSLVRLFDHER